MDMFRTILIQLHQLAVNQVDPNMGTAVAYQNAQKRLQEPTTYDAIFPVIAFVLVIVIPICIGIWVIFKTVTEKDKEPDET